jgi:hypothetical protein
MPIDAPEIRLARSQLEAGMGELESDAEEGRYNTLCIRAFASAAAVLQQQDVVDRAIRLLGAAPDKSFWAGTISNFALPKTVPEGLRTIDAPKKLEEQHPCYREEEIVGRIRSLPEERFALCLEGRFQDARSKAGQSLWLEEVGDTLAVLGKFDTALSVARDPALEDFRQKGVLLVLAIELFRHRRMEESEAILAELESSGLSAWERIQLALGFAGRVPWDGYPYPDW